MGKKTPKDYVDDESIEEISSDSDTLTKSKTKKQQSKKKEEIVEEDKPKPIKPKKKMTEAQLNNLKKGHAVLKSMRDKNKLNKKIEASKILLENNIDITTKSKSKNDENDKIPQKKKSSKKIVEEESSEEEVIIVKKKKKKPKKIIIEESESSSEEESVKQPKERVLKSQENKRSSVKISNPLPNNFNNYF